MGFKNVLKLRAEGKPWVGHPPVPENTTILRITMRPLAMRKGQVNDFQNETSAYRFRAVLIFLTLAVLKRGAGAAKNGRSMKSKPRPSATRAENGMYR